MTKKTSTAKTVSKPRHSTKAKSSAKASPQAKAKQHSSRVMNRSIRSTVNRDAMSSNDPFSIGRSAGGSEVIVDFASETGRRGSETLGLGSGPITTSIINSNVARKRSRHAVLTNAYAKRAIDVLVSNVVGSGFTLQSQAPDEAFQQQVEDLWNDWIENVDITDKLSFPAMQSLVFRSMVEGGDCFVRMRVRRADDELVVPLQLQVYEAEQVPIYKNENFGNNHIIAGIEFGMIGQIVNYHMLRNHPGEFVLNSVDMTATGLQTVAVPADDVIHIHDIRRPNEVRGLPILSQALIQLSDLNRYLDAELVRKKAAALIGGFITKPDGSDFANPFITNDEDPDGNSEVHIEDMEPGTFPLLPPGFDVRFSQPADVGPNFAVFMRQQLLQIAAAVNLTYTQLTGDVSQGNDRTLRVVMLEFKRIAEQYQQNIMVHQFCRTVFRRWFDLAVLSGALVIPPGMDMKQARKVRWTADPWDYMNPLQELNVQVAEVRAGFVSRSEQIIKRGGNPEDVDNQIRIDQDREKEFDLVYTSNAGVVSNAGVAHSGVSDPSITLQNEQPDEEPDTTPEDEQDEGGKDVKKPDA